MCSEFRVQNLQPAMKGGLPRYSATVLFARVRFDPGPPELFSQHMPGE